MAYDITPEMADALDIKSMPENKNWQTIAPQIISRLTPKQLRLMMNYIVTQAGISEIDAFYEAMGKIIGGERSVKMIDAAKRSKYNQFQLEKDKDKKG